MTGHPLQEARTEALQHVTHWIEKPFAIIALAAKVRLVLSQQQDNAND